MNKQLIAFFTEETSIFRYVLVIIGIYFAQTFFKVSACRRQGNFSFNELVNGMVDHFIYFVGIVIFFFAGTLIPNENIITFADKSYNITDALTLLAYVLMARQAYKCFQNIQEKFEVSDDDIPRTKTDVTELNDYGMRG